MRLFIAIELGDEIKNSILAVQEDLKRNGVYGNYTKEENLHLTLAFIGEYNDPSDIQRIMEELDFREFEISLSKTGCFGDLWWVGLDECGELDSLVKKLRYLLSREGIPFDRKKFRSHITVLRRAEYNNPGKLDIRAFKGSMKVHRITLMRSNFTRNGVRYDSLGSVYCCD